MKAYSPSTLLIRYDTILCLACVVFFLFLPDFDLKVSQYFYDIGGNRFFGSYYFIFEYINGLTKIVGFAIAITLIGLVISGSLIKNEFPRRHLRIFSFLLCAFILGPGLLVNSALKGNWGRPRPRQVVAFGGSIEYRPPFAPSFGRRNCQSFVCGDASVGYFFFSLALFLRKRKWLWLSGIAGAVIGASRMIQGEHFFSDVLFSGWVVWFSSLLLYTLFFEYRPHQQTSPLERAVT